MLQLISTSREGCLLCARAVSWKAVTPKGVTKERLHLLCLQGDPMQVRSTFLDRHVQLSVRSMLCGTAAHSIPLPKPVHDYSCTSPKSNAIKFHVQIIFDSFGYHKADTVIPRRPQRGLESLEQASQRGEGTYQPCPLAMTTTT